MVLPDMPGQGDPVAAVVATDLTGVGPGVPQPLHPAVDGGGGDLVGPGRHQHGAAQGEGGHLGHEGRLRGVVGQDGGRAGADLQVIREAVLAAVGLGTGRADVLLLVLVAPVRPHVDHTLGPLLAMCSPNVLPKCLFTCGPDRTQITGERSQLVVGKVEVPRHSRLLPAAMAGFLVLRQLASLVGDVVTLGAVERFRDHLHPAGQSGCQNVQLVRGLPHSQPFRQGYSFYLLLHAELLA